MDENILTWNPTNWLTVTLMAAISFGLLGLGQSYMAKRKSNS